MEISQNGENPPCSFENLVEDVAEHLEGNLVNQDGTDPGNKGQLPPNLSTAAGNCIREQHMIDGSVDDANANDVGLVNNIEVAVRQSEASSPHTSAFPSAKKAEDHTVGKNVLNPSEIFDADGSGSEEERTSFMTELENFYREKPMEFKPVKFYGEPLNLLKLWRAVIRLGGYDTVTASKLWRQVGESFHPPKTCTTVSWTFRIFYEKSLLEYERHKKQTGEIKVADFPLSESVNIMNEGGTQQSYGAGRARRDAAARAMQGWHVQRFSSYGESAKGRSINASLKRERNLKSIGLKHKKFGRPDDATRGDASMEETKHLVNAVADVGPPADWVKVSVRETRDCFEVYALVPGLLREEVRVQSDPAGRLVITGEPEQADNPWGITPFKKVVSLPARIDPLQTSAVVSLHGRLCVRVPFEHSD